MAAAKGGAQAPKGKQKDKKLKAAPAPLKAAAKKVSDKKNGGSAGQATKAPAKKAVKKTTATTAASTKSAPPVRKPKMQYKRVGFTHPKTQDLQTLVQASVDKLGAVKNREQVDPLDGTIMVLSGVHASQSMLVAKLMLYTPGQQQKYLELDPTTNDYVLGSLKVTTSTSGVPREFLESMMYVAIFGNHVMYLGSTSLRSGHLERHLNWLLRQAVAVATGNYMFLADQQSESAMNTVAKSNVKSIEIGGDIEFEEIGRVPTQRKTKDQEGKPGYRLLRPCGEIANAVTQMFGPIFADASLKAPLRKDERVAFKMTLDYRNRKKTKEGLELMDSLAVAGRHFDEDTCIVNLEGGGSLKGSDIKVSKQMTLTAHPDGRLVEPDVWVALSNWLAGAIQSKIVEA